MDNLILPTYKAFSGLALFAYIGFFWFVWPALAVAMACASGFWKVLGWISLLSFCVFAINRDAEMITLFLVIPGLVLAGAIGSVLKSIMR